MRVVLLVLCAVIVGAAAGAEKVPTEAQARYFIYAALLTQAAPDIVADTVELGPELARLPRGEGAKVYQALVAMTDGKPLAVRKATPEEVRAYGARPGLRQKQPLYAVDAGNLELLVQYDLQGNVISFVGERNTPWEDPKLIVASTAAAGAARPSPKRLDWTGLFAFDSATLSAEARAALDREVLAPLAVMAVVSVEIRGHADRIGAADYNQKLSEWRAGAVADYLAARGIDPARIDSVGFGQAAPVKSCRLDVGAAELIACLAPNRRVVVEIAAIPR
jgi:outer membrane protein OmpA-like peptidoglycan-associated protein